MSEAKKPVWIPTWLGLVIIVAATWLMVRLMTGGEDLSVPSQDSARADQQAREFAWIERSKDAVRAKLKDPDSAQFRGVYFRQAAGAPPMACGEVNSKNSFGGYGGFQRFLSASRPDLTFLAEQMDAKDFAEVWNKFCAS